MEEKLNDMAIDLLSRRYMVEGENSPAALFTRVANYIGETEEQKKEFYEVMSNLEFLPNSPTLMNAGTSNSMLSACFLIVLEDSIDGIYTALKDSALISQFGGGVGTVYSKIRPEGDIVGTTKGVASGPISFMKLFNTSTDVIKQGGKRRGANMGLLSVDHPDIFKFVHCKANGDFTNFNISVALTDKFMYALEEGTPFPLVNPRTNEVVSYVDAYELFKHIVFSAWNTGDPGIVFIDRINAKNPIPSCPIEGVNPCAEACLSNYESCNLGSINLNKVVKNGEIDMDTLYRLVRTGVNFLDRVIDVNKFPLEKIKAVTLANRKIGLGIMGLADMLIRMNIPYDEGIETAENLIKNIRAMADEVSLEIGAKKGAFPNIDSSIYAGTTMRNATRLSIAPTGSISIIANGVSSGCEPLFALAYTKKTVYGEYKFVDEAVIDYLKRHNLYSEEVLNEIMRTGMYNDKYGVLKTAQELSWKTHLKMQAALQKHVDQSISKTINLPASTRESEVAEIYMNAWKEGCKSITVFRDGSKIGVLEKGCEGESCTL